jgi:hypothetical protein
MGGGGRPPRSRSKRAPGARPTVAALTMVRNEAAMLPRWVEHYAAQCGGPDRLLVIDDNSDDGSTEDLPCPVVRIPPVKGAFEPSRLRLLSSFAAGLLEAYDAVAFTDADEFLVPDPDRYATLADLLAAKPHVEVFGAMGLNLVHQVGVEASLDPGQPLLAQRRLAKFIPLMCKPALKTVAAPWTAASHGVKGRSFEVDPDLYMFHAKFSDRDALRTVAEHRRTMVRMDGRAKNTNWKFGGDAMVELLDEIAAGVRVDSLEPFRPTPALIGNVVRQEDNTFRARGERQVPAMRSQPFVLVPDRFHGLV